MPDLIADSTVLLLVSPSLQWSVYFSSSHSVGSNEHKGSQRPEISGFKITQKIYNLWREYCYDVYIVKQGKRRTLCTSWQTGRNKMGYIEGLMDYKLLEGSERTIQAGVQI